MKSDLSREAADLVEHGRQALRPSAADKARILANLKAQLPPPAPELAPPTSGGMSVGAKALLIATGAAVVVAAVVTLTSRQPGETQKVNDGSSVATSASVDNEATVAPRSMPSAAEVQAAPAPSLLPSATVASSRGTVGDRLSEEVALLTRAQREFHSGNLTAALAAVDEHRRKFARGTLGQERVKLRVEILCGLGRTSEANVEQRKLGRLGGGKAATGDACGGK